MGSHLTRSLSRVLGTVLTLPGKLALRLSPRQGEFYLDRSGRVIKLFPAHSPVARVLLNASALRRGEVALVGVSLRSAGEAQVPEACPGLFSLWQIRKKTGLAPEQQTLVDREYLTDPSLKRDLGILLRALVAHFLDSGKATPIVPLLGIEIDNLTNEEALQKILEFTDSRECRQVSFVNAHCVNVAQTDPNYLRVLNESALCLADGSGVRLGSALNGYRILENVNGTDLFPRILHELHKKGGRLSLLGAKPGVVDLVVQYVKNTYPNVQFGVCRHGYFEEHEQESLVQSVAESDSDVLLVALGVPGQDLWLDHHLSRLNVGVGIGVGGLFDFYSGTIPRAPAWLRSVGMEWSYRLYQEPRRLWKRYLVGNVLFLYRVVMNRRIHK